MSVLALARAPAQLVLALALLFVSPPALAEVDPAEHPCLTESLSSDPEAYRACIDSLNSGEPVPSKLAHVLDLLLMPAHALYLSLAQPESCVVCLLLLTVLDIVRPIGAIAFDLLLVPTLVLLSLGFMFALLVGAGKILLSPVQSARPWTDLAVSSVRFVIAIMVLGGAALLTASTLSGTSAASSRCNSFDVFFARLIEPFMGTSVSLGMVMLDHVTLQAFRSDTSTAHSPFLAEARYMAERYRANHPRPSTTRCRPGAPPSSTTLAGFDNLLVYASGLQLLGSLGMAQGIGFLRDAQVVSEGGGRWIAFIAGILLLLLFAVFIIVAGIRLLDPLLRVLLIVALSPLLVAAWVFAPTRSAARVGLRAFAYAFFFFIVAGVIYGIAFSLILASAATSSGVHEDIIACKCKGANAYDQLPDFPKYDSKRLHYCYCAPEAFKSFHDLRRCVLFSGGSLVVGHPADVCGSPTVARQHIDMTKILITIISLLLAQSLIALVTSIAGSLSDYSAGDNIAQGAESQMRGLATSAVHTSAYAGATVLRTMASKARSFLSSPPT